MSNCHRLYDVDLVPKEWIVKAKSECKRKVRKFSVSKLWKKVEINTKRGQRGDWGVLLKRHDSKRVTAEKAVKTKRLQGQSFSEAGKKLRLLEIEIIRNFGTERLLCKRTEDK